MIPTETERKFLINKMPALKNGTPIRQGYLTKKGATVRVRIAGLGEWSEAWLTIKGRAVGLTKPEFEYSIPVDHAEFMLATMCDDRIIEKTRYLFPQNYFTIELDVFEGNLKGLVVAEIEVADEDWKLDLPEWIGLEVTDDKQYKNKKLARHQKIPDNYPKVKK